MNSTFSQPLPFSKKASFKNVRSKPVAAFHNRYHFSIDFRDEKNYVVVHLVVCEQIYTL